MEHRDGVSHFLATVAENTHPQDRAKSLGVFCLWRDLGYAIGALLIGLIADVFGIDIAVIAIGLLTLFSALVLEKRMRCKTHVPKLTDWIFKRNNTQLSHETQHHPCQAETLQFS